MAESVIRLRVESSEYDAKIKRAAAGLLHMEQACHKAGGTLAILDSNEKAFVASLGHMATVSTDARGKIGELSKAYVELRSQYNRLTDEEKQGDYGKALSKSLDQLKDRIQTAKSELKGFEGEIGSNGNILDQLSSKFGISTKNLVGWGAAIAAAKVALDVMKDAFLQSEQNIDEWGRITKSAEGAYKTFLDTINSGNWSEFFRNLNKSIESSRELYDALDRLGSIKANNQAAIAIEQQAIAKLRVEIQKAQNDGDQKRVKQLQEQVTQHEKRLSGLRTEEVEAGKTAGIKEMADVIQRRGNAIGGSTMFIKADAEQFAKQLATQGQSAFDSYAQSYQRLREKGTVTKQKLSIDMDGNSQWLDVQEFDFSTLSKAEQRLYAIADAITQGETEIQKGLSTYASAVNAETSAAQESFRANRIATSGGSGSSDKPDKKWGYDTKKAMPDVVKDITVPVEPVLDIDKAMGPFESFMERVQTEMGESGLQEAIDTLDFTALTDAFDATTLEDFNTQLAAMQEILQQLPIDSEEFAAALEVVKKTQDKIKESKGGEDVAKSGKSATESWVTAAGAIGNVGNALSAVGAGAAGNIIGIIAEAIANVALAAGKAMSAKDTTASGWAWIGAAAAITGTMVTSIAAIKSATETHAQGGVIKGGAGIPASGDNVLMPIMGGGVAGLNPGEIVLNAAQQSTLAQNLDGGTREVHVVGQIDGETIRLVQENSARRRRHF